MPTFKRSILRCLRPIVATLALTLILGGCKEPLLEEIKIPECPGIYKVVNVIHGTISGEDLDNLLDNVLEDRICIARLKALLGDPKMKKILKKLPKDAQQRVQVILDHRSI